jgi:hypothetical protein
LTSDEEQASGPPEASGSAADGDEFDAIQRRIAAMRREAMERIESVRRPRPGGPARPTITPPLERPAPPRPTAPTAAAPAGPPPEPAVAPAVRGDADGESWTWDRQRGGSAQTPDAPAPAREPTPASPAVVGPVIHVADLPLPELVDVVTGEDATPHPSAHREVQGSLARTGVATSVRDTVERIAVTRSVTVLGWQALSVVILVAALAWVAWFPFAAGAAGGRALVVVEDVMAPTIRRGDVVVVRPSPDLPYPLGTVVAIERDGLLVTERIVGEEVSETERILLTRSDGVSEGPDMKVSPQDIVGSVRRIHRLVGHPVLWFTSSSTPLPGLLAIVAVLSSVLGTAALLVRLELRRSDRALVSAIASGTRTPSQH